MSRLWWIIILVAAGVGLAVVIGVLGNKNDETKADAVSALCASLQSLETAVDNLTGLDPKTASKDAYQSDVDAVQSAWDDVKSDAQDVKDAPMGDLDSAWNDFTDAVKGVPDDASVQDALNDIAQSADQLVSTAKSTASEIDCSSS
jgi:hypothetical protein